MGKAIAYTALVVVCVGLGAIVGGLAVYFAQPYYETEPIQIRKATCVPRRHLSYNDEAKLGTINFTQSYNHDLHIKVHLLGIPERNHGFHIHTYGVVNGDCTSAGGHFNPKNESHGGPLSPERHVGDLGNVNGAIFLEKIVEMTDKEATLFGEDSILGRSMVIHEEEDDLVNQSSAGGRLACCTIIKGP